MANQFSVTNAVAQGMLNGTGLAEALGANALLRVYAGTMPADADAALGSPTLLGTLTLAATPFSSFADANPGGRAIFGTVTSDTSADNSGTPAFFRVTDSTGTTTKCQGTAGNTGADLNFGVASIAAGSVIAVSTAGASYITLPEGP